MTNAERIFAVAGERLEQRRIPEALILFEEAANLGYDADQCASGRWRCWMLLGCFERAWLESESIARRGGPDPHRFWDGRPFRGRRLMIRCLHGLGDTIQFIRLMPLLRREARSVTAQVHPELVSLLAESGAADRVITWSDPEPSWDQQIEVMELPRALGITVRTIPASTPYLSVKPERLARSRRSLAPWSSPKAGVVWASSSWDPARSISFSKLQPIFRTPGLTYHSLQHGPEAAQIAPPVRPSANHSPELVDTAADIANLDLVITVDTMVAHLAGALGRPVWSLLPFHADWRWMLDRPDSPWYPTMQLFRQPAPGDWASVVSRVANELSAFAVSL